MPYLVDPPQVTPPQPLLSTTIPAYLYKQYQNDDDLLAFVASYNAATQVYVDWFNSANLPFYPALSGALLEWVAEGLYGLPKTSLTQTVSGALGALNTAELNTIDLNAFTPPTTTYYSITDDVFKRILTWNYYKGDGKRFCVKWLKRRIMRFLLGKNGLDPNPLVSGFVIGPENTQAVSVTVASDVLTVTINGAYISSLVQLEPNILDIFKAAFLGGVLDLPAQYTYAVSVVFGLVAFAVPAVVSTEGIGTYSPITTDALVPITSDGITPITTGAVSGDLTTQNVSVIAVGGDGAYTAAWSFSSGGTGITINSPASLTTSFTGSGIARGTTVTGVAKCVVTDGASNTVDVYVTVTITNISVPTVTLSPTSLSVTGASASITTGSTAATISGGKGPYTIEFTWQTGGAGLVINSSTADATSITAPSIAAGTTLTGTLLCTVTDAYGQTATATCAVSVARASLLQAYVSPSTDSVSSSTTPITTGNVQVVASGGQPPYAYSWSFAWTSRTDDSVISISAPHNYITALSASGMSPGHTDVGIGTCVVTDALGQTTNAAITSSFTYLPPILSSYTSAQNVTVPAGYSTAIIEGWGGGGGGQGGNGGSIDTGQNGAGGGGAGYFRHEITVSGGQTIQISSVGAGGSGGAVGFGVGTAGGETLVITPTATNLIANGGQPGDTTGGAGGSATGANQANITGGAGGNEYPATGAAGTTQSGVYGNNPASNGNGGAGFVKAGRSGISGIVIIRFS